MANVSTAQQMTIKAAHRAHVVRCMADRVKPLTLDQFFVRAIAAAMLPADKTARIECRVVDRTTAAA